MLCVLPPEFELFDSPLLYSSFASWKLGNIYLEQVPVNSVMQAVLSYQLTTAVCMMLACTASRISGCLQ